jgi:predicted anti-sigma-YlaC factor YlaD
MKQCESIAALLPLSAAGLLDAAGERTVREHVRECASCRTRMESFGDLAGALAALPAPAPPADLALRTQSLLAAELAAAADRRRGGWLALAGAAMAWISWFGLWDCYRVLTAGFGGLLRPGWPNFWVWLAVSTLLALLAAPIAAALLRARRHERSIV